MKHISKMCYKRCDGWMVRVSRDCVTYNKYFGSNSYGSTESAFDAAKDYLEKLKFGSPHLFVHSLYKKGLQSNNKTGYPGISETVKKSGVYSIAAYQVCWREFSGKNRVKAFYYGKQISKDEALSTARKFREEMVRKYDNI